MLCSARGSVDQYLVLWISDSHWKQFCIYERCWTPEESKSLDVLAGNHHRSGFNKWLIPVAVGLKYIMKLYILMQIERALVLYINLFLGDWYLSTFKQAEDSDTNWTNPADSIVCILSWLSLSLRHIFLFITLQGVSLLTIFAFQHPGR